MVLPRTAGSPSLRTKRTGSTGSGKGGGSRSLSGSERNVPSPEQRDSGEPINVCLFLCMCVCVCVRACVRACVCVCVRVRVAQILKYGMSIYVYTWHHMV